MPDNSINLATQIAKEERVLSSLLHDKKIKEEALSSSLAKIKNKKSEIKLLKDTLSRCELMDKREAFFYGLDRSAWENAIIEDDKEMVAFILQELHLNERLEKFSIKETNGYLLEQQATSRKVNKDARRDMFIINQRRNRVPFEQIAKETELTLSRTKQSYGQVLAAIRIAMLPNFHRASLLSAVRLKHDQ